MRKSRLNPTPSQTIGPFFHDALLATDLSELVPPDHPDAVRIKGTVFDGAGEPVTDAMVEIQHASSNEGFPSFGRSGTTNGGEYAFVTVKPAPVPVPGGGPQAPHVLVSVFARGLLRRLVTRVYFPDEEEANAADPVLSSIEDGELRETLVARTTDEGLRFDIRLQGERQTAFFELEG